MEYLKQAVSSNDKTMLKLADHLAPGNMVMSSVSLGTVMAMILAGAKNNSQKQILDYFHLSHPGEVSKGFKECLSSIKSNVDGGEVDSKSSVSLRAANRIYTEQSFQILPEYTEHLKSYFNADPMALDFLNDADGARKLINTWVEEQTNEKIKDLLAAGVVNAATRVVLVNALYFKGEWEEAFDPRKTRKEAFHVDSETTVEAQMMHQKAKFGYKVMEGLGGATALSMPYKGNQLEMIFVLPKEESCGSSGLKAMEQAMSVSAFGQELEGFAYERDVVVTIPKFKIESTHELNEPLKKSGVVDIFDAGSCDLSGISGDRSLFVSVVVQKAFIEVNEEGAEAAAATAGVMLMRCALPMERPLEFKCNRPFFFLIRIKASGLVLFSGRVANPTL